MANETSAAAAEWRAGWTLVLVSSIGFSFYSVLIGSLGLFMEPLDKAFGWSRALISSGPGVATVITALLSPLFGLVIDRLGTRRLVLPGLVLTIATLSAFSLLSGMAWQWLALWVFYGFVSTSIKSTSWTTAVLGVFSGARGLALGLTYSGSAISSILVPPVGNWLIAEFGWRAAYVWLALGWGGLTLLLSVFFLFDIHDRNASKHARQAGTGKAPVLVDLPGLTLSEARRSTVLWRLALSVFLVMSLTTGLSIHSFPILTGAGVSRANAAWMLSLGGAAGIAGTLVTGLLLDRFPPNWIGGITNGMMALAFVLLMDGISSPALVMIALIVNGYGAGTKMQIAGFLTASYGGMKNFGAIYGVIGGLMALSAGLGPMLAGSIFDRAGDYGPFLTIGAVGCAFCGFLILTLPRYPDWQASEAARPVPAAG